MRMGRTEGWRTCLLAVGLVLVSARVTSGQEYPGGQTSSNLLFTIGVRSTSVPREYCCAAVRIGVYVSVTSCEYQDETRTSDSTYVKCAVTLAGGSTRNELTSNFQYDRVAAVPGGPPIQGSVDFIDINECDTLYDACSAYAACYNSWGTFRCSCTDGYYDRSGADGRPGSRCEAEGGGGQGGDNDDDDDGRGGSPVQDIDIWVWVLIAVGVFVVLLLVLCCCCFYSDCWCYDNEVKRKVIKRIKVIRQPVAVPVPAPAPAPVYACPPPVQEEKKIVIQLEQPPPPPPPPAAPLPIPYGPVGTGHSAFVANSGMDGKVYVASPTTLQEPVRTVPWSDGGAVLVNAPSCDIQTQPVYTVQQQEPQYQVINQPVLTVAEQQYQDVPQVLYTTTNDINNTTNGMMYFEG